MTAKDLINMLPAAFNADAAGGEDLTVQFNVSTPMTGKISGGACTVSDGVADNADLTITMEDDDFIQLMKGELNGMQAFMTGKLKLDGNIMLAQKLGAFFDASKLG